MNENQHSITVLFNPAPDPQAKTGGPQPTPFCITACFSNLPAGTDFVKTKRFYENLMRSLEGTVEPSAEVSGTTESGGAM